MKSGYTKAKFTFVEKSHWNSGFNGCSEMFVFVIQSFHFTNIFTYNTCQSTCMVTMYFIYNNQKKILNDETVVGFEALLDWNDA